MALPTSIQLQIVTPDKLLVNEQVDELQIPGSDAVKTGSLYGFANINARQARNYERQEQGVWHSMEIRMVGQQHEAAAGLVGLAVQRELAADFQFDRRVAGVGLARGVLLRAPHPVAETPPHPSTS